MAKYSLISEAQSFECPDLCLFADGDPVHCCDHCEYSDGEEQDRKKRAHGLSFIHFALGFSIGNDLILGQDEQSAAKSLVDGILKFILIHRGIDIDLRIDLIIHFFDSDAYYILVYIRLLIPYLLLDDLPEHCRGHIYISELVKVRHYLRFITHTDKIFARFDQSSDFAGKFHAFERHAELVTYMDIILFSIFIHQPHALRVGSVIGLTVHENES